MTKTDGANGHNPPKLGDVEFSNGAGDEWGIYRDGELVRNDLSFAQLLAVIRGEVTVDDLAADAPDEEVAT